MDTILQLDPTKVKATSNVRFGLKRYRLDRLKEDIAEAGGVETPVQVYANTGEDATKFPYILWKGFYRTQSVLELNKAGAGMTLPAMVVEAPDEVTRIRRQVAENQERENMSAMDMAFAMKQLTDQKVDKIEIRKIFAVPGGKKGMKVQPASNSYVNMHLGFLEFPKSIQNLLHDGKLGVGAAHDLRTKHSKDKWDEIIAKILEARDKEIDREEAADQKLLKEEKGAIEKAQAAEVKGKEAAEAAATVEKGTNTMDELKEAAANAFKAKNEPGLNPEQRKEADKKFRESEEALKQARQAVEKAKKEADKAKEVADKAVKSAENAKAKIEQARKDKAAKKEADAKAGKAGGKGIGKDDVNKAAKEAGSEGAANVKLNGAQMREIVHNLTLAGTDPEKLRQVALVLEQCFLGVITEKQNYNALKKLLK